MMSTPSIGGGAAGISRPRSTERRSTFDITSSSSLPSKPSSTTVSTSTSNTSTPPTASSPPPPATTTEKPAFVDKDKEADLHRLVEKAQHGNLDAERAVSPALHAQAKRERERESSVGRGRSERTGDEVQVVEVGRNDDKGTEELEEVTEEEEENIDEDDEEEQEEDEGA